MLNRFWWMVLVGVLCATSGVACDEKDYAPADKANKSDDSSKAAPAKNSDGERSAAEKAAILKMPVCAEAPKEFPAALAPWIASAEKPEMGISDSLRAIIPYPEDWPKEAKAIGTSLEAAGWQVFVSNRETYKQVWSSVLAAKERDVLFIDQIIPADHMKDQTKSIRITLFPTFVDLNRYINLAVGKEIVSLNYAGSAFSIGVAGNHLPTLRGKLSGFDLKAPQGAPDNLKNNLFASEGFGMISLDFSEGSRKNPAGTTSISWQAQCRPADFKP